MSELESVVERSKSSRTEVFWLDFYGITSLLSRTHVFVITRVGVHRNNLFTNNDYLWLYLTGPYTS
jgi:hypothetical protein